METQWTLEQDAAASSTGIGPAWMLGVIRRMVMAERSLSCMVIYGYVLWAR